MDFNNRIGWAITYIKDHNPYTWKELGEKLSTSKDTIAAYAIGKGLIKGEVLKKLVTDFGFLSVWLLEGEGEPYPGASKSPRSISIATATLPTRPCSSVQSSGVGDVVPS